MREGASSPLTQPACSDSRVDPADLEYHHQPPTHNPFDLPPLRPALSYRQAHLWIGKRYSRAAVRVGNRSNVSVMSAT